MTIQSFIINIIYFINNSILPLLFGIAFFFFLWNAFQFFIVKGATDDGREKARRLMLWGILAFVIMVSIWGIVNMFVFDLGLAYSFPLVPDYIDGGNYAPDGGNANDCKNVFGNIVWCSGSPSDYGI